MAPFSQRPREGGQHFDFCCHDSLCLFILMSVRVICVGAWSPDFSLLYSIPFQYPPQFVLYCWWTVGLFPVLNYMSGATMNTPCVFWWPRDCVFLGRVLQSEMAAHGVCHGVLLQRLLPKACIKSQPSRQCIKALAAPRLCHSKHRWCLKFWSHRKAILKKYKFKKWR